MKAFAAFLCLCLVGACAGPARQVTWWFDVGNNATDDAAKVQAISQHRDAFTRLQPSWDACPGLDGNVSRWWGHDEAVAAWNGPLQKLKCVHIDASLASLFHPDPLNVLSLF